MEQENAHYSPKAKKNSLVPDIGTFYEEASLEGYSEFG